MIRAGLRFAAIIIWVPVSMMLIIMVAPFPFSVCYLVVRFIDKMLLMIIGIRVHTAGKRIKKGPTLFVSNHTSYLDILVLGSLLPASFVSKSEVRWWWFVGQFAALAGTVFVERTVQKTLDNLSQVRAALHNGRDLIVFPEGTTNNGVSLLKFKSSFLKVVEEEVKGEMLTVQPISIVYTHIDGKPVGDVEFSPFAWFGPVQLLPHLLGLMMHRRLDVLVTFYSPVETEGRKRKEVAAECEKVVSEGTGQIVYNER